MKWKPTIVAGMDFTPPEPKPERVTPDEVRAENPAVAMIRFFSKSNVTREPLRLTTRPSTLKTQPKERCRLKSLRPSALHQGRL